jgi:hypothetical protein
MKVQFNGLSTVIGSKNLSQQVKDAVLAKKDGKVKMLEVTVSDDDGQEFTFRVKPQLFSTGSLGGRLTLKGEAKLVEVDATPDKTQTKEMKKSDALKQLESDLLA